jgi:chromosome segregation ATPase
MNEKKISFIFGILYLFIACIFSGCKSTRVSTDENILYYQRKIDELEATVRLYEQRITIADEQIRNDLDSLKYLGERAKTVGDTIDELIELFAEYQRGVEQLLRDYNTLRNEVKELDKGADNSTIGYRNKIIGYGSRIYFIC